MDDDCKNCSHERWDHRMEEEVYNNEGEYEESLHFYECEIGECECKEFVEKT